MILDAIITGWVLSQSSVRSANEAAYLTGIAWGDSCDLWAAASHPATLSPRQFFSELWVSRSLLPVTSSQKGDWRLKSCVRTGVFFFQTKALISSKASTCLLFLSHTKALGRAALRFPSVKWDMSEFVFFFLTNRTLTLFLMQEWDRFYFSEGVFAPVWTGWYYEASSCNTRTISQSLTPRFLLGIGRVWGHKL